MDALMTVDEVAKRLNRPVATIRYWRATGAGPRGARIAGRVMWRASDVERWIEEQFDRDEQAIAG